MLTTLTAVVFVGAVGAVNDRVAEFGHLDTLAVVTDEVLVGAVALDAVTLHGAVEAHATWGGDQRGV